MLNTKASIIRNLSKKSLRNSLEISEVNEITKMLSIESLRDALSIEIERKRTNLQELDKKIEFLSVFIIIH